MKFIGRILITVAVWLIFLLITVTNGQVFTQSLIHLSGLIVICVIWATLLIKRKKSKLGLKITAAILVLLHFALFCFLAANLKSSYESQKEFNKMSEETGRYIDGKSPKK